LACEEYGKKRCHVKENREQEVISRSKLEELKWCGCERRKVAYPTGEEVLSCWTAI